MREREREKRCLMRACKLIPGHLLRAHSFAYKFCLIFLFSIARVTLEASHTLQCKIDVMSDHSLSLSACLAWIHRRQWKCLVWFRATSPRGCKGIIKEDEETKASEANEEITEKQSESETQSEQAYTNKCKQGKWTNRTVHQMRTRNSFNHLYLWVNLFFRFLFLSHLSLSSSSFAVHFFRLVTLISFQRHWFTRSQH